MVWGFWQPLNAPPVPPASYHLNSLTQSEIQLQVKRDFKKLIFKILVRCFGHQIALKNHGSTFMI